MKTFLKTLLKLILFAGLFIASIYYINIEPPKKEFADLFNELVPVVSLIVISLLLYIFQGGKMRVFGANRIFLNIFIGLIFGALWFAVPVVVLKELDMLILIGKIDFTDIYIPAAIIFLNALAQELLVRGYAYQVVKKEYGLIPSLVITTGVYLLLNYRVFDEGLIAILFIITMSLMLSMMIEYSDSLLISVIMHAIWMIGGTLVTNGVSTIYSFKPMYNIVVTGKEMYTGGNLMLEGSIITVLWNVILLILAIILWSNKKENKVKDEIYGLEKKRKKKSKK